MLMMELKEDFIIMYLRNGIRKMMPQQISLNPNSIGQRIRELRQKRGLTQAELAW